jgi:hypothetical protein
VAPALKPNRKADVIGAAIVIDDGLSPIMSFLERLDGQARISMAIVTADKIFLFLSYAATAMLLFHFARLPQKAVLQT